MSGFRSSGLRFSDISPKRSAEERREYVKSILAEYESSAVVQSVLGVRDMSDEDRLRSDESVERIMNMLLSGEESTCPGFVRDSLRGVD